MARFWGWEFSKYLVSKSVTYSVVAVWWWCGSVVAVWWQCGAVLGSPHILNIDQLTADHSAHSVDVCWSSITHCQVVQPRFHRNRPSQYFVLYFLVNLTWCHQQFIFIYLTLFTDKPTLVLRRNIFLTDSRWKFFIQVICELLLGLVTDLAAAPQSVGAC